MACDFQEWVIQQILLASLSLEILQGIDTLGSDTQGLLCSLSGGIKFFTVCHFTSSSYLHYGKVHPAAEVSVLSTDNTGNLEEVGQM